MAEKIQFRPGDLLKELHLRAGSDGAVAKRDLERYYFIVKESQPVNFTLNEMLAIINSLMHPAAVETPSPSAIKKYLWAEIIEGADYSKEELRNDLEEKYQVDLGKLARKVKKLSHAETFALQDLSERVWFEWCAAGTNEDYPEEPETASLERNWRGYVRAKALERAKAGREKATGDDYPW